MSTTTIHNRPTRHKNSLTDAQFNRIARRILDRENLRYALERPEEYPVEKIQQALARLEAPAGVDLATDRQPTITITEHLAAADMDEAAYVREQQRMQRERILRRALRSTPKGDPKAREY
uniref:Uncharacterized protein n=1 Tax=viral metagenome TaxID=1070528 RepID=A0A6M3LHP3_9ZZZZ